MATDNLNVKDPAATTTDHQISTVSTSTLTPNTHSAHEWTLSLTPTGLRIDTNIATPPNLYKILLSGISQLDLDQDDTSYSGDSSGCLTCASGAPLPDLHQQPAIVTRKAPLWRSNFTSFPLYNAWPPNSSPKSHGHLLTTPERPHNSHHTCHDQHSHHRHHHRQRHYLSHATPSTSSSRSMFILDDMIDIYNECFLGLPDTDYEGTIGERYHQGRLDPLLANAIFAWSARHGAIYHNLFPGQDPNDVGECYFDAAKELLKDRFMIPTMDTLHSILVMYIYAIGRPPDDSDNNQQQHQRSVESEAYIFLGLAIRMCLELKLHTEQEGTSEGKTSRRMMQMERYRRFFWALYFLETLCALHSDRPFSLPSEDQITVTYPELLDNELGERRWRAEYMIKRFRITRIYRNIIQRTAQDKLLISSISELDASLCQWYDQLPPHLQYSQGDHLRRDWRSNSFREQACIKLNFEYHFQRSQLYAVFMKSQQQSDAADDDGDALAAASTMERMAKAVCLTSATMTAELMTCWKQLRQRWCHFSLESMMMAVNVFAIMMKDVDHLEQARAHLTIMLDILLGSPIQHHRYVKLVISRIQQLVYTTTSTNDAMVNSNDGSIIFSGTTDSTLQDQPSQQNGYRQPIYLDNQSRYEQQYEASGRHQSLDIYSSMQKSSGMIGTSLSDLPFSDFLYNPVMEIPSPFGPYTTATNTTIQQQPMSSTYPPQPPTHTVSSSSLSSLIPSQPTSMLSMNDTTVIESANPNTTSSSSLSPSSRSSSSISPRKGPTTLAPTAYQQDLHPDYSAASLWITLHQPADSSQLDSFDYTALQQPSQSTDQHYSTTH